MNPSQITQILLRLFSLSWFIQGISQAAGSAVSNSGTGGPAPFLIPGLFLALIAVAVWIGAPAAAKYAAKGNDEINVLGQIRFVELLGAMLVGLGLFFCLSSFGAIFNWLHYFWIRAAAPKAFPDSTGVSFYNLSREAVTFGAGVLVIATSRYWAQRISRKLSSGQPTQ